MGGVNSVLAMGRAGTSTAAGVLGAINAGPGANQSVFQFAGLAASGIATASAFAASAVSAAAAAGATVSGSTAFLAAAGPWGALAAGVIAVLAVIFKGADPRQVPASQVEQCFELAGLIVSEASVRGYITPTEASAAQQSFWQLALQYEQQQVAPLGGNAYSRAVKNLNQVFGVQVQTSNGRAPAAPLALDVEAAVHCFSASPPGWYAQSITAGQELARQYFEHLLASRPAASTAPSLGGGSAGVISGDGPPTSGADFSGSGVVGAAGQYVDGAAVPGSLVAGSGGVAVAGGSFTVPKWAVVAGLGTLLLLAVLRR